MICEIHHLCAGYDGATIVEDLSLSLEDGEILMLLGPTGCGKTTVLRALAGLIPLTSGEIRLGDQRIGPGKSIPTEKRHIGMVFQDFALFPHLNVERNIGFRLRDRSEVDKWLCMLDLHPLRRTMPNTLSGGQKQRVALARSLAHQPAMMLLDEPLSNLDASLKDSLRWSIRHALKAANVPVIWVTHDQDEAMAVADRVGILNQGHLEQLGTPEACFAQPASRFVAEFLGEASFVPADLAAGFAQCSLGRFPAQPVGPTAGKVEMLVRPDDLTLSHTEPPNGQITWTRYEGGTRLNGVELDSGESLKARVSHEHQLKAGEPIHATISATHPLITFAPEKVAGASSSQVV